MNLFGVSRFTLNFRKITINSLSFLLIYFILTTYIANLVRTHLKFPEFTMILVGVTRKDFEFSTCCANSLWIYYTYREFSMNSLFFSRIHYLFHEFIIYPFSLICVFTMTLLSFPRIYQEFTFRFANS